MPDERAEIDPYAPPSAGLDRPAAELDPAELAEAEAIRRDHIRLDSVIRGLGIGAYFVAALSLCSTVICMKNFYNFGLAYGDHWSVMVMFGATLLIGLYGRGLRGLRGWARWTTAAILGLWLGASAIGGGSTLVRQIVQDRAFSPGELAQVFAFLAILLVQAYLLSVAVSRKSRRVCSSDYRKIVAQTRRVRAGEGRLVKVLLVLASVILVAVLISFFAMLYGSPA